VLLKDKGSDCISTTVGRPVGVNHDKARPPVQTAFPCRTVVPRKREMKTQVAPISSPSTDYPPGNGQSSHFYCLYSSSSNSQISPF
jgi:hypothetical protein